MVHLVWTLLGITELDPFNTIGHESSSDSLARILYGIFIIGALVLLVNMMIAVLSHTYERVQVRLTRILNDENDRWIWNVSVFHEPRIMQIRNANRCWNSLLQKNSLRAWSFKRAVTIRTYRDYHPVPVPLNLLSQLFLALCRRKSNNYNNLLDAGIETRVGCHCRWIKTNF